MSSWNFKKKKWEIPQGQSQRELDTSVINRHWSHCQFLSTFRGRGWSSLVSRWTGDEVICFLTTYYRLSPENGSHWPGKWEWKVEDDRNEPFSPHLPDHRVPFKWTQLVSTIRHGDVKAASRALAPGSCVWHKFWRKGCTLVKGKTSGGKCP